MNYVTLFIEDEDKKQTISNIDVNLKEFILASLQPLEYTVVDFARDPREVRFSYLNKKVNKLVNKIFQENPSLP